MERNGKESRIIVRARITDIPGELCRRPITLGEIFCTEILGRSFNTKVSASTFDAVHIPHGFDSDKPVKRWFIYDLNVACNLEEQELLASIPHHVYQASLVDNQWMFVERDTWLSNAKSYCAMFCWGGREEQKITEALRKKETGFIASASTINS
ncbi:hypothetical protein BDV95DRAFT_254538 [Massariosphaeria phaeospora]|uniref:Uncharacterized protein n=1 Tax=Massariosphaeria phaeospora TaxID=100035 RepID=A0A7C8MBW8_9PLEO|nr:hypothetical protein BDV95DRAFT_254538 [Massariosphaeria phaeospora]